LSEFNGGKIKICFYSEIEVEKEHFIPINSNDKGIRNTVFVSIDYLYSVVL